MFLFCTPCAQKLSEKIWNRNKCSNAKKKEKKKMSTMFYLYPWNKSKSFFVSLALYSASNGSISLKIKHFTIIKHHYTSLPGLPTTPPLLQKFLLYRGAHVMTIPSSQRKNRGIAAWNKKRNRNGRKRVRKRGPDIFCLESHLLLTKRPG